MFNPNESYNPYNFQMYASTKLKTSLQMFCFGIV